MGPRLDLEFDWVQARVGNDHPRWAFVCHAIGNSYLEEGAERVSFQERRKKRKDEPWSPPRHCDTHKTLSSSLMVGYNYSRYKSSKARLS